MSDVERMTCSEWAALERAEECARNRHAPDPVRYRFAGTPEPSNKDGGLISVNVEGHAKPAHRMCPTQPLRSVQVFACDESVPGETE